eukprot:TRINITY_DN33282_c0_g1_i1.p1 TRINITY_DN33282_c0_g1~~TRINITY_DN33282_c0_g1_i1.p1  ORF type:complete len:340 (+),score=56.32 TRINITY_DN33282_c0_g1_i1:76-1095(+)
MPSQRLTQPGGEARTDHKSSRPHEHTASPTKKGHGVDRSMVAQGTHQGSKMKASADIVRQYQDETVGALDDSRNGTDPEVYVDPSAPPAPVESPRPFPVGTKVEVWLDADGDDGAMDCATGGWQRAIVGSHCPDSADMYVVLAVAPGMEPIRAKLDSVRLPGRVFRNPAVVVDRMIHGPPEVGTHPPLSMAERAGFGSYRVWLKPRGTMKLPSAVNSVRVPFAYMLTVDLRGYVRQEFMPLCDKVPNCAVLLYFFHPGSDDYIPLKPAAGISENPLPDVFTDAPGSTKECPIYWEIDQRYVNMKFPVAQPVGPAGAKPLREAYGGPRGVDLKAAGPFRD